ncbi:hypothetical protein DENSPDRAFT_887105 [Dentipellis sp. KUC8613]|nr:hypothetical protein DENSPDRAFT_887105 [Dentipellis sp. KUC8613]
MLPRPIPVARPPRSSPRHPRSTCCRPARAVTTSRALATALDAISLPRAPSRRSAPSRPATNGARHAPNALSARETASRRLATAPRAASPSLSPPRSRSRRHALALAATLSLSPPRSRSRRPVRALTASQAPAPSLARPFAVASPSPP